MEKGWRDEDGDTSLHRAVVALIGTIACSGRDFVSFATVGKSPHG